MVADISEKELIQIGLILIGSYLCVQIGKAVIRRSIRKTYNAPNEDESRVTGLKFLYNTLSFLIYSVGIIAIIYSIPPFKNIGKTLFAGAGIFAAILGFASGTLFSLVTLPVEFDASKRAIYWLERKRIVNQRELMQSKEALNWAAGTYVVAALASIANLVYLWLRFGRKN